MTVSDTTPYVDWEALAWLVYLVHGKHDGRGR